MQTLLCMTPENKEKTINRIKHNFQNLENYIESINVYKKCLENSEYAEKLTDVNEVTLESFIKTGKLPEDELRVYFRENADKSFEEFMKFYEKSSNLDNTSKKIYENSHILYQKCHNEMEIKKMFDSFVKNVGEEIIDAHFNINTQTDLSVSEMMNLLSDCDDMCLMYHSIDIIKRYSSEKQKRLK